MKAYILCFILTILFTYLAERNFKRKNRKCSILFSILSIFIPTFICGIRNSEIGRDIDIYVAPVLKAALTVDFSTYMAVNVNFEKGYILFVYIISKLSSNLEVLLFFIQLIPCSATFIFAYYYRKEIPMWFVMTTYLLTWYLRSYTMMRQSIAVGFILLSIITFEKKQNIKTLLLFALAFLFHNSAIVAIGLYFIIWICNTNKINFKSKFLILTMCFIAICMMLYFYENLIYLFYDIGIFPEKFVQYLNSEFVNSEMEISASETIFRLCFIFLGILYLKISNKDHNFIKFFLLYLISMGPYIISFKIVNAERINYYYYYPALLYIVPSLTKIAKKDKINKTIMSCILIIILLVFWIFKYPIKKNCDTYPYKTDILKFLN